ncbi:CaiB/BaiF CoA transferase family protein [Streptomyces malaysiensis]|uniref:CaiB/BaiF CoA transferase family protein n=1 Tax=Streptomyces malaysiensis TaxID=92644 RepID=UPI0037174855
MDTADDDIRPPLHGIRVLELGNYIAAPTAGRLLADFGAEVIKVERPDTGDELRTWRLHAGTTSLLYRAVNRNKKSIALDLRTAPGRRIVLDLVRHCDVVLENFRPGTLERWGLGPDALREVNPELVLTRISAFGQTGPLRDRPGFAAVAEAVGGLRELVGEPDRPPSRVGVSIGDTLAGLYAALGTLMHLFRREIDRTSPTKPPLSPELRTVDVALNEAVLSVTESLVPDHLAYGERRTRTGGRIEGIAPSNAYPCRDGTSVVIAGNGDGVFRRLMRAVGWPDLAEDPALRTNADRWKRRDELDAAIGAWTVARSRAEVLDRLEEAAVPAGPIFTAADICADEQYRHRNMIQYLPVDTGREPQEVGFPGIVPVLGRASAPIRHLGPDLGQHTHEVLSELLGLSADELSALTDPQAVS